MGEIVKREHIIRTLMNTLLDDWDMTLENEEYLKMMCATRNRNLQISLAKYIGLTAFLRIGQKTWAKIEEKWRNLLLRRNYINLE